MRRHLVHDNRRVESDDISAVVVIEGMTVHVALLNGRCIVCCPVE